MAGVMIKLGVVILIAIGITAVLSMLDRDSMERSRASYSISKKHSVMRQSISSHTERTKNLVIIALP